MATRPEIVAAWNEYKDECRKANPARYEDVESWAWSKLKGRLLRLNDAARISQREKGASSAR
jgi:hypothetical protein